MSGNLYLWLAVTLSGAVGCGARFGAVLLFKSLPFGFPLATLFVNVVGGFAMGAVMGHVQSRETFPEVIRLALTTGFLGGFTTFSAFSIETVPKAPTAISISLGASASSPSPACCSRMAWKTSDRWS